MTAYNLIEVAVAVFLGNMMTIGVVKGYMRMKKTNQADSIVLFFYGAPLLATAIVLSIAR